MLQQLLWIEVLSKLGTGLVLLLAPAMAAAMLGLPRPGAGFWPRLLGAVLVGIGAASALQGFLLPGRGLALAGSIAINLSAAAFLFAVITLGPPPAQRGRLVLWLLVGLLLMMSLIEIAAAG
jgi:hypothetical protein